MKDTTYVDLELDIEDSNLAEACKDADLSVVEFLGILVVALAITGGVVSVFALLLGCCHG